MLKRKPSNVSEKEKHQKPKRSSSFGNFDRLRNNSMSKADDSTEVHEGEPISETEEQNKTSNNGRSLGKKMRAISWTMKKKVGKKYIKALSEEKDEEDGEDALPYRNSDPVMGTHTEKVSLKASDSMDSLYSGQSSSSGITSCSDGTNNRDSFRLDDDSPYSGPFCGRARVHTDFTPSPYDTDSLKIKKGDIIDIISKTPMGMWTGVLNNKVGNFKFIYVDVISEEEAAPKKVKACRRSRGEKPKTLQEFLEMIHLQEYTSTLLLNGYETLEDLKDIKESHLIELNIENSEDRMRLLSAAENLLDEERGKREIKWVCVSVYGAPYTRVYGAPYTYVRVYGAPYTYVRVYGAPYTYVRVYGAPYTYVRVYGAPYTYVRVYGAPYTYVRVYGAPYTYVRVYGAPYTYVRVYGAPYTYVRVYGAPYTYVRVYGAPYTYVRVYGAPYTYVPIQEQENEPIPLSLNPDISLNKSQLDDCPRDSGCYISSGNSDNGKEDVETENLPDMVEKITITEASE
ncbi:SAM domain-containing protein SAMSN-1 [Tupaia chinensis]|uniref:SAM domain-containing protein SAMSN-1 n=1 Tax=Tupaia chinensis TaxID=246437 RepID=L9KHV0_TUPCH|nr:SAM domain-containing protein SAMSN-1 [Tupaia chinensis]